MKKLYHVGTYSADKIEFDKFCPYSMFGAAFYLTDSKEQAITWARNTFTKLHPHVSLDRIRLSEFELYEPRHLDIKKSIFDDTHELTPLLDQCEQGLPHKHDIIIWRGEISTNYAFCTERAVSRLSFVNSYPLCISY